VILPRNVPRLSANISQCICIYLYVCIYLLLHKPTTAIFRLLSELCLVSFNHEILPIAETSYEQSILSAKGRFEKGKIN
jgi:hypothetical protein